MVRITTRREGTWQVICIDGRLDAEGVVELETVVAAAQTLIRIDLQGLRSADEDGLDALRRLEGRGAPLSGVRPYIRLRLQQTVRAGPFVDRMR